MRRGSIRLCPGTLLAAGLAAVLASGGSAQRRITDEPGKRPPYLQNVQGTSVTVCWTTQRPRSPEVRLRAAGGKRERRFGARRRARRHAVTLTGLTPGETYEYRAALDGGSSRWLRFRTAPAGAAPFRFGVFGDFGVRSPGQRRVIQILERENPDFSVVVGDLGYPIASEGILSFAFFRPLARYAGGHVVWHVFGNHDVDAQDGRPLDLASVTPNNGPAGLPGTRTYSFDYGDAHFAVLDSNLSAETLRQQVRPWLEADLLQSPRRWKFVLLHDPPYSSGLHGSAQHVQSSLVRTFERAGVDAVFAGHDHHYERFHPIDGVTYLVSGNGGARLYEVGDPLPETAARENQFHGLTVVDVDGDRAVVRHVLEDGREFDRAEIAPRAAERAVRR